MTLCQLLIYHPVILGKLDSFLHCISLLKSMAHNRLKFIHNNIMFNNYNY